MFSNMETCEECGFEEVPVTSRPTSKTTLINGKRYRQMFKPIVCPDCGHHGRYVIKSDPLCRHCDNF